MAMSLATILPSLIGAAGSLSGTGISTIANAAANKRAYHHQRDLMELQSKLNYNYQKKMAQWSAQNGAMMTRQGLESAGYNPMLAFSGGNFMQSGGTYSAGGTSPQQAPVDLDLSNALTSAYKAYKLDKDLNEANIRNLDSTTRLTNAKEKTEGYNQKLLESQMFLNMINTELGKKDLSWKDRMYLMQEKTGYLNAAANHLGAEAAQMNAHTSKMDYKLRKEVTDYENVQRKQEAEYIKKHPRVFNYSLGSRYLSGLKFNLPRFK